MDFQIDPAAIEWTKSSRSGGNDGGNCVWAGRVDKFMIPGVTIFLGDVELQPGTFVVVKDEHGGICQYTRREWEVFSIGFKAGEFDHLLDEVSS